MAVETTAPSVTELCRAAKARRARARARSTRRTKDARAARDRRRARGARAGDPRGQRARSRGRARDRALRRADGPPGARRRRASRAMADGVRAIAALPDPVGEVIDGRRLANGLDVRKVRVPLGVVAVVYEARPNVTIDAAALCLKSGNAVRAARLVVGGALQRRARRGSRARRSRRRAARRARWRSWPAAAARSWPSSPSQEGVVDLIIPRGGEGLKKALSAVATVPGDLRGVGQLPRLRRRVAPTSTMARADRRQRQGPAARACATRPRRCSCTRPSPTRSCRARVARAARARASSCAATSGRAAAAPTAARCRGDRGGLGRGVPRADPGRAGRRLRRGGDRARQPLRLRPLRGDRDRATAPPRGRSSSASTRPASTSTPRRASPTAASSAWAPRSATRRRSCTRAGRSACASCARSSTWSRATGQVRGLTLCASGSSAGRSTRRTSAHLVCAQEALVAARARPRAARAVHEPPHKEVEADPGVEHRLRAVRAGGRGRRRASASRASRPTPGPVLHGRYPEEAA